MAILASWRLGEYSDWVSGLRAAPYASSIRGSIQA